MADRPHPGEKLKNKPFLEKLKYRLEYAFFLLMKAVVKFLPRKTSSKIAGLLGILVWHLDIRHRRRALSNVGAAFAGEKSLAEIRQIARNNFIHIAQTGVDLVRASEITRENYNDYFIYEGTEIVEPILKKRDETQKGIIAITAHLGSQEMLVAHIFKYGIGKESIVTKRIRNPYIDYYVQNQRETLGAKVLPHRGSGKAIVKRILKGEIIAFAVDQRASSHEAVRCGFFGRPVMAHKAIAQLAMAFDLPVVPVFAIRNKDGKYRLIYQEPIKVVNTGDREKDAQENTQLFQDCIERMVRLYPEQWWWAHDRWKYGKEADSEKEADEE